MRLGPLGGGKGEAAGGKGEGVTASAMDGVEKGAELGPEGMLLGQLGFGGADRRSSLRNRVELANIERFLADSGPELRGGKEPAAKPAAAEAKSKEAGTDKEGPKAERETEAAGPEREATHGAEERRDAAFADVRELEGAGLPEAELQEADAQGDAEGRGGSGEDEDAQGDEEDRPGAAWLAEELEERERRRRSGRGTEGLGAAHRCRGTLSDGSRCLRKPMQGTPYCREHRHV